jgi:ferredoxin-type protein NapH
MKTIPIRQKVRAVTGILMLLFFPAYYYYLSPAVPLMGASNGIVTGSLMVFTGLFIVSTFLGRSFCAYLCPGGNLQDQIARGRRTRFPRRYFGWLKFLIWASWLGGLLFLFRRAGGIKGFSFTYHTRFGFSVSDLQSLIVYFIVVGTFFLLALLFGRRAACHTICWIAPFMILGSKVGRVLMVPALRIVAVSDSCVDCGRCDEVCPMSIPVSREVQRGAISSSDCILCGNCVDTCGRKALSFSWQRDGEWNNG